MTSLLRSISAGVGVGVSNVQVGSFLSDSSLGMQDQNAVSLTERVLHQFIDICAFLVRCPRIPGVPGLRGPVRPGHATQ